MASSEQNGIDILCDAAGSDLLNSLFSLASPDPRTQQQHPLHPHQEQQLEPHQLHHLRHQTPRGQTSSAIPSKRKLSDASPPSASHVCHICKRVYERADHLTRHLRSHENARPYQCSRCPKRFNRADLLTRHETTHDRDGGSKGRPFIKRSDRAAEACLNCAASKAKCEDQKPCKRCRNKSLVCQMPVRRGQPSRVSDGHLDTPSMPATGALDPSVFELGDGLYGSLKPSTPHDHSISAFSTYNDSMFLDSYVLEPSSIMEVPKDGFEYFKPVHTPYRDLELYWDLASDDSVGSKFDLRGDKPIPVKRSSWVPETEQTDSSHRETEGLEVDHGNMPTPASLPNPLQGRITQLGISHATRDRLFAVVLAKSVKQPRTPPFPSVKLLNYFLQAYFTRCINRPDNFVHFASFDPNTTSTELLCAIIASGAAHTSKGAIWKFGLSMDEITHRALNNINEMSRLRLPDLSILQAYLVHLEVGQWSGFNHQMEIAEGSLQPLITVLKRSGKMSFAPDSSAQLPTMTDTAEALNSKWKHYIARESYKRLILRLFLHDSQSSIALSKNPLISISELDFSAPLSHEQWSATSAEAWRDLLLISKPVLDDSSIPQVAEMMQNPSFMDEVEVHTDAKLYAMTYLYGLWGQISAYRNTLKTYTRAQHSDRVLTPPAWASTQHEELYRTLSNFRQSMPLSQPSNATLAFLAEFLMMALHVSPDEVERVAGKRGEEEARRVVATLTETWLPDPSSRQAIWHAGQVLRQARMLMPMELEGFNAIAVYLAGLTLWAYGVLSAGKDKPTDQDGQPVTAYILLDGADTTQLSAFLTDSQGTPSLTTGKETTEALPLSDTAHVLAATRDILKRNAVARDEPPLPLVESLSNYLKNLRSDIVGNNAQLLPEK